MNFLQELETTFGNQIKKGLSAQTTLKGKTLDKAKDLVLAASLAGLIRKVSTERGTDYLYRLLEDYDDSIAKNFGEATEAEYNKWKTDGEQLMPVLLISSIVKENIINHISRVIKENYQSTKKIFALLIPVLLSVLSKELKVKKYNKKDLVKALRAQKYNVRMQADDDITRELGMGTWHLNKTVDDSIEDPGLQVVEEIEEEEIIINQPQEQKTKEKSGMPVWLWPLMLLGVLAMLIVGLQLGLRNEEKPASITKAQPENKTIADNIVDKKPGIEKEQPKEEENSNNYTKDYFNKDYFADSKKNDPDNKNSEEITKADIEKEKPEEVTKTDIEKEKPEEVKEAIVEEKIEEKSSVVEPVKPKENEAKPILLKDKPQAEEKQPEPVKEKKEEPKIEEKEPEKPKKKNYKGPLALLDMVANRTTASVLDFGSITDGSNQLTAKGKSMFNDVAEIMIANPALNITIRGHHKKYTDSNENYNANAGAEAKANAALNYLINNGVNSSRVKAMSVGFNEPVNARDPGNDKNDRISVKTK